MKHRQLAIGIGSSLGMIALILDGHTALEGARLGIDLCLKTVIPSLFPFFVLSSMLTGAFFDTQLHHFKFLSRIFNIPSGSESILIPGFLGGYPVGAQCIADSYQKGLLSQNEAQRMLGFCSNAGPAFLFGMVGPLFPSPWMVWCLWGIHIVSALLTAQVLARKENSGSAVASAQQPTFSKTLYASLRAMVTVCGWVVLFRVAIQFLKQWILWIFPVNTQVLLIGLLELANGCCELKLVEDVAIRFLICSGILSFGGLCVTMQTMSVIGDLSIKSYLLGKILQTAFSLSISMLLLYNLWYPLFFCGVLTFFRIGTRKKTVAFGK